MRITLVRRWTLTPWVREAGGLWLGQHVIIIGLVALFQYLLQSAGLPPANGTHSYSILDPFMWWDSGWYSHIAQYGYDTAPTGAFPPLFPLLEAIYAPMFGSQALAGVMIANTAGLGACLLLRWVLDPLVGPRASQRTLLYLLCFPTAVFFLAAYTESLYLLLSLAVFAALHRRAFWWAGIFAGLAIMTRYTGAFLVFPLLVALWQARAGWWRYLSAAIAPLLMGGFWVFLIARFHELPTTAVSYEWHMALTWPWIGLVRSIAFLVTGGHSPAEIQNTASSLLLTVLMLVLALATTWSRLPLAFKIYTDVFVLFVLSNPFIYSGNYDALFSTPRYLLPLFPLFIPLGSWGGGKRHANAASLGVFFLETGLSAYLLIGFAAGLLIA